MPLSQNAGFVKNKDWSFEKLKDNRRLRYYTALVSTGILLSLTVQGEKAVAVENNTYIEEKDATVLDDAMEEKQVVFSDDISEESKQLFNEFIKNIQVIDNSNGSEAVIDPGKFPENTTITVLDLDGSAVLEEKEFTSVSLNLNLEKNGNAYVVLIKNKLGSLTVELNIKDQKESSVYIDKLNWLESTTQELPDTGASETETETNADSTDEHGSATSDDSESVKVNEEAIEEVELSENNVEQEDTVPDQEKSSDSNEKQSSEKESVIKEETKSNTGVKNSLQTFSA